MTDNQVSGWKTFKLDLGRLPWINFLVFMFTPLVIMQMGSLIGAHVTSIFVAMAWIVIVAAIYYLKTHAVNPFALITFLMILTRFIGGFLERQLPAFVLTESVDNTVIGLIFIGSMLWPRPFIMSLLDKELLKRTEEKFGKSKFWYKAWFDINIVWGLFYVIQGIIVSYATVLNMKTGYVIDFILSWPMTLVLLFFSVSYPQWYWTKHADQMKEEIEAAEEYEKHLAAVKS
jgi:intracellular septation protein A